MALVATTLASACAQLDKYITVASAASFTPGRYIRVDQEMMQVNQGYVSGVTIPVVRGRDGTAQVAHVTTAAVVHGLASDWLLDSPQTAVVYPTQRPVIITSYTGATNTMVLPPAGCDLRVILNGTTADTFTVPVPTVDMDGCILTISSNGVAQHLLTFTGGLSGAGGSYDVITVNATAPATFQFIAVAGLWQAICGPAISGTTTAIAGVIS